MTVRHNLGRGLSENSYKAIDLSFLSGNKLKYLPRKRANAWHWRYGKNVVFRHVTPVKININKGAEFWLLISMFLRLSQCFSELVISWKNQTILNHQKKNSLRMTLLVFT